MSAPTCVNTDRYTSKDLLVSFLPCADVEQVHIQILSFHEDVAAGTFKLRVNGEETAAITFSATVATLLTSMNSAIAALDNVGPTELVATGTLISAITLTSTSMRYFIVDVTADALTGNATDLPNVTSQVTQQGSTTYTISSQISAFGFEESVDTVDVTAISEYETTEIPVKSMMSWNATIFDASEDWKIAVFAGQSGIMTVYPKGKFVGNEYFQFRALIEKAAVDFPDHDVVSATVDGQRQGAMIIPFNSIYKG